MNSKENYTYLYLPRGEWLEALLTAFKVAALELMAAPKSYEYSFTSQALPIIFQAIRSKEVWTDITDPDTLAKGGFTGSDITREQRVKNIWTFPLYDLEPPNKQFPKPIVYIGSTPNLRQKTSNPTIKDLNGSTIYTTYPNITELFLKENSITAKVKERQGTIEGRWRVDKTNGGIVDIINTGKTMKANNIEMIQTIMKPRIVYVESPAMKQSDQTRVNDLREILNQASFRQRQLGSRTAIIKV